LPESPTARSAPPQAPTAGGRWGRS
jgi:hypothetical protein